MITPGGPLEDFDYGPGRVHWGFHRLYRAARAAVMQQFQDTCCAAAGLAETFIISGHSMGGGLSYLNAADMVRHWDCAGVDLDRSNLFVVTVGAPWVTVDRGFAQGHFSCADAARCLPGNAVAVANSRDATPMDVVLPSPDLWDSLPAGQVRDDVLSAGEPITDLQRFLLRASSRLGLGGALMQPVVMTILETPCPAQQDFPPHGGRKEADGWCHAMFSYARPIEEELVEGKGWGTTCTSCGNFNDAVRRTVLAFVGADLANLAYTPTPVQDEPTCNGDECTCPQAWDACFNATVGGTCVSWRSVLESSS